MKKIRFTLFQSLRPLSRAGVIKDGLAGFGLAALNIPQVLGYTKIAGTPVVTGFYTLLFPLLAFSMFGSSRYLVVSADSATAAMIASGLSGLAPAGSEKFLALAGMVALLTGGFPLLARVFRLGFLVDFLSQTVLVGFLTGVGIQVGVAVLGEILGLDVPSHRTVIQLSEIFRGLSGIHLPTVAVSLSVASGVLILGKIAPKIPGPLLAVVGTIAASAAWDFAGHGIATIGPVSGGLPHLGLPGVEWKEIPPLLPIAGSCFVMIAAQSAATARIYAARHHQALDENSDLIGLSAANIAAALSGTFVVNGSPTQTSIVESSGGQSQFAQLSTAFVVALVLLFLTHPLQYLPRCVLGTLVFMIAARLVDLKGLRKIGLESPGEHLLALTTVGVVVGVGVEQGILLAIVLSLLRIVWHSYHPHTGVMVKDDNNVWRTLPAAPGTITSPGLVIYRFSASLFYANAGLFSKEVRELAGASPSPVRWLVVDAEAIAQVDYSAARVILELQKDLQRSGTELIFARVQPFLKADLDRHHVTEAIGESRIFPRLQDALRALESLPPRT